LGTRPGSLPLRARIEQWPQGTNSEDRQETTALQIALQEIRQLREDRQQERSDFEMRLRQREEKLRWLEAGILQRTSQQLSLSNNRNNNNSNLENLNNVAVVSELSYKLKPDNFEESV